MKRGILNEIAKLVMHNDFDLSLYDFNQIEWSRIPETLEKIDQETKTVEQISSEKIIGTIKFPVREEDKTSTYYLDAKDKGIELEYMPWGHEVHISADGFVSYEDGSGGKMYYPNSLLVMDILKKNGYPLI